MKTTVLALVALLAAGEAAEAVTFTRTDLAAGVQPQSAAPGDFNRDGRPDLSVANIGGGNISILLGNGNGTFQAPQNFAAGSRPTAIGVADFNGDNNPDLAVANSQSDNMSILLGNGAGAFGAPLNLPTGGVFPRSVAVADFDRNGTRDVAIANPGSANVSVFLGNGNGTFSAAQVFPVLVGPESITGGDFNEDGNPDLAAVSLSASQAVSILFGNGNGTFQPFQSFPVGSLPRALTSADFNGDNHLDIATANQNTDNVSILLGNGNGTFQPPQFFAVGDFPQSITVGDFDGDLVSDLATINFNSNNASVIIGTGTGSFGAPQNFAIASGPAGVTSGDFNGDALADLVSANFGSSNVTFLRNTSPPPVNTPVGTNRTVTRSFGAQGFTVTVTFAQVTTAGQTSINLLPSGPPLGTDFQLTNTRLCTAEGAMIFDIQTTAVFTNAQVTINFSGNACLSGLTTPQKMALELLHFDGVAPDPDVVTQNVNPGQNRITSIPLTGLSPFVVAERIFQADIAIDPNRINVSGNGVFTVYLNDIEGDASAADANANTIRLEGVSPLQSRLDGSVLVLKFRRADFVSFPRNQIVTLQLTGETNDGVLFRGSEPVMFVGR